VDCDRGATLVAHVFEVAPDGMSMDFQLACKNLAVRGPVRSEREVDRHDPWLRFASSVISHRACVVADVLAAVCNRPAWVKPSPGAVSIEAHSNNRQVVQIAKKVAEAAQPTWIPRQRRSWARHAALQ
jgi:hypothetical protein